MVCRLQLRLTVSIINLPTGAAGMRVNKPKYGAVSLLVTKVTKMPLAFPGLGNVV